MMPGGLDRYKSCCLVETAQAPATAAKASGAKKFELVVYSECQPRVQSADGCQWPNPWVPIVATTTVMHGGGQWRC